MSGTAAAGGVRPGTGIARFFSDDRLAQRAVQGDNRAFTAIFDRYHQGLYRYCLAIVGDSQDAQDALQNTMVKALRALPGEERRIELKPWLYRIAHNESIELLRRRRDMRGLDAEFAALGPGPAEEAASKERLQRLIADLGELPERQRGAVVMRELGGLDFADIGAALGTSSTVARQTLYEARLSLRQMNEGREMSCETVTRTLSDGDGRVTRRRDVRAHLRACTSCHSFHEEIESRERDLAALSPLPAVAAAGLLRGVLGSHASGGNGLVGAFGSGTVKSLGASAVLKGTATVAVVVALGVGAADRGGLIDTPLSVAGDSTSVHAEHPGGIESAEAKPIPVSSTAVGATPGSGEEKSDSPVGAVQVTKPDPEAAKFEEETAEPDTKTTGSDTETAESSDPEETATPTEGQPGGDASPPESQKSTSASKGKSAAHSHGKGHAKQLPEASAHGQETAAGHKNTDNGPVGAPSHPAHPEHPTKPPKPPKSEHPSNPKSEKEPPSAPPGEGATDADGPESTPPDTGADESSSGKKHGKKS